MEKVCHVRKFNFIENFVLHLELCHRMMIWVWVHTYRAATWELCTLMWRVADVAGSTSWRRIRDEHDEWRTGNDENANTEEETSREDVDSSIFRDKRILKGLAKDTSRMFDRVAKLFRFSVKDRMKME